MLLCNDEQQYYLINTDIKNLKEKTVRKRENQPESEHVKKKKDVTKF